MSDSQPPSGTGEAHASAAPKLHDPEKLRRKRIEAGLNQTDLAQVTGIQQSHLSKLERGASNTTAKSLARIAKALGCTVTDLLAEHELEKGAPRGRAA
jgi:transcriptional regulator with XRE-family HTH domain